MIPTLPQYRDYFYSLFTKNLEEDVLVVQKKDEIVRNVHSI